MAAYITTTDIYTIIKQERYEQLITDKTGAVSSTIPADAIAKAESEVNSYLAARYTVPLTTVPAKIKQICVDIALYHLYSRAAINDLPDSALTRYEKAVAFLKDISRGIATLPELSASVISASAPSYGFKTDNENAVFKRYI